MKHISRWRTLTAAVATATVAAGAFGLTAVTASPGDGPDPIELSTMDQVDESTQATPISDDVATRAVRVGTSLTLADDDSPTSPVSAPDPASATSQASQASQGSQASQASSVSAPSPVSAVSAPSPVSAVSAPSPVSALSPISPVSVESAVSPVSAQSPVSPVSVESPSSIDS